MSELNFTIRNEGFTFLKCEKTHFGMLFPSRIRDLEAEYREDQGRKLFT